MRAPEIETHRLPATSQGESLIELLSSRLGVRQERLEVDRTYHDTFDWRLWHAGRSLVLQSDGSWKGLLLERLDQAVELRHPAASAPGFCSDLPAGPMRDALSETTSIRRLLPLVRVTGKGLLLHILDRSEKTVCRVTLEERRAFESGRRRPMPPVLRLFPLRGYESAAQEVRRLVAEEIGELQVEPCELEAALALFDRQPGDYTSKLGIQLDPTVTAAGAARQILRSLLETLRANEVGVREDLDTEFLHDLRVAVRRTRSGLAQIPAVFPSRTVDRFRRGFKWLGTATGPLRDLDVFLLKMPDYRDSLPEAARRHLDPLQDLLMKKRREEHRRLVRVLDSKRYERLITAWQRFLDQEGEAGRNLENAQRPVTEVARERIWRSYRRVLKRGRRLDASSPDADFHRERIEAKKLRYLMEFFRSLFPEEIDEQIKALKRVQDNLGDFNDYSVHRHELESFAVELGNAAPIETQLAIGRLLARFEEGQTNERRRFAKRFRRFSSPENRETCAELFRPEGGR